MTKQELKALRRSLGKTQKELSTLLGVSLQAVHSYEQGWRTIPAAVERQVFFLAAAKAGLWQNGEPCWEQLDCPEEQREHCPAWELRLGSQCWFVNGTVCDAAPQKSWAVKMRHCRRCAVFEPLLALARDGK